MCQKKCLLALTDVAGVKKRQQKDQILWWRLQIVHRSFPPHPHSPSKASALKPVLLITLKQMKLMRVYAVKSLHPHMTASSSEWGNAEATGMAFRKSPVHPGKWAWKWHISIWASFSESKCKVICFGGNNPNYKIMGSKLSLTVQKPMSAFFTKVNGWKCCQSQKTHKMLCFLTEFCIHRFESITHLCTGNKTKQNKIKHGTIAPV